MSLSHFRQEAAANLRLALPLIGAQMAALGMGTVDTIFAGRLGSNELAAVALGVNVNVLCLVVAMGVLMSVSPIIAHATGAGHTADYLAPFWRRALKMAVVVAAIWMLTMNLIASPLLHTLGLAASVVDMATGFVHVLSASCLGFSLWFTLRFTSEGFGRTRLIFAAGMFGLSCNVVLDWILMFGHLGVPALGIEGCALATAISSLLMAGAMLLMMRLQPALHGLFKPVVLEQTSTEGVREMLRIGLPSGAIMLAEAGLFVLVGFLVAFFGTVNVAANQIAINFAALLFMIPVGLGLATTVRVGQAAGRRDADAVRARAWTGVGLGLINAVSNGLIMIFAGGVIAAFYTSDPDVIALASRFMVIAAAFQLFDAAQVVANGALRGLKDTRFPMVITLAAYWAIGLPVAWYLGFHVQTGAVGLWWGLSAGLAAAALGLSARLWLRTRSPDVLMS